MRLFIVTLCATAAVASVASAQPAASPSADDAKCLLDMVALSNSSAQGAQRVGQEGVIFFVGRISAHDPGFDFARLPAGAKTILLGSYLAPENGHADVFIPISIQTERRGHYTNFQGVTSAFSACFPKPASIADAEALFAAIEAKEGAPA